MKRRNENLDMYKMTTCLYFNIIPKDTKLYKGDNSTDYIGQVFYSN